MFDIVNTPFSYGRELIICSSLQEFSKTKESTLHVILHFYLVGQTCAFWIHSDVQFVTYTWCRPHKCWKSVIIYSQTNNLWKYFPHRHVLLLYTSLRHIQYTTHETGQKTRVLLVSPSKNARQVFHGQLSASRNLRYILSSVDGPWFQRHRNRNTRPAVYYLVTREMLRARHFSRDMPWVTLRGTVHFYVSCTVSIEIHLFDKRWQAHSNKVCGLLWRNREQVASNLRRISDSIPLGEKFLLHFLSCNHFRFR